MADKSVRDELAELTEAVHELHDREVADEIKALREEIELLRAEKPAHTCCGHACTHWHYWPAIANPYPYTVTWTNPAIATGVASGAYGGGGSWITNT